MELKDFEPLFGEPKVEWSTPGSATSAFRPFLFQVHAPDSSHLRFHATDFFSSSFAAVRSIEQLDDMRDDIGIGGSWSEFLEYLVNSIKLGDVKIVLEGKSKSDGCCVYYMGQDSTNFLVLFLIMRIEERRAFTSFERGDIENKDEEVIHVFCTDKSLRTRPESARLIAQKSKGMPRISISLLKLVGNDANETMATLSLDLYKAHQKNHKLLLQEQEGRDQLTKKLSAEKEKSEHVQKQLDGLHYPKWHKSQNIYDKLTSDTLSATNPNDVSDIQMDQNPGPKKASKRVVPAHRRSKVRGARLQDTEDD